jgi:hypothetical protein
MNLLMTVEFAIYYLRCSVITDGIHSRNISCLDKHKCLDYATPFFSKVSILRDVMSRQDGETTENRLKR